MRPTTNPFLMNCREFRRKHDAYVDDTLSGADIDGMVRHRQLCERCAKIDTRVRRALLVARNLPTIEPSPVFNERLQARLRAERTLRMREGREHAPFPSRARPLSVGAYSMIAAGVLAAAGLAGAVTYVGARHDDVIRLAPVVASRPEAEPSPLTTPTIVASMPAGMPLWPAVFVAQQAPWHFASDAASH